MPKQPPVQRVAARLRRLALRAFGSPLVLDLVRAARDPAPPPPPPSPPTPPPYAPVDRPLGAHQGVLETLEDEIHQLCFVDGHYPDGWLTHPACPCCDGHELRYTFSKYGLSHSECVRCAFVFLQPYPTDELLGRLYNAAYYPGVRRFVELPKAKSGDRGAIFSFPEPTLERIIAQVSAERPTGRWLEVGGGLGHFAHLAQTRLPAWQVSLNDMNRESLEFARQTYGLATIAGAPDSAAFVGQQFDVISMMAALEHVPRPYELLVQLVRLLKPGGELVLGVPRFSPLNRLVSRDASASVIPPYHVSHFDELNIVRLLERVGGLDVDARVVWQDKPNAFKLTDMVKTWPYWRIEVPTQERDTPRAGMIKPYSADESRWLNALGAADAQVEDLIHQLDGGLLLTVVVRKRSD